MQKKKQKTTTAINIYSKTNIVMETEIICCFCIFETLTKNVDTFMLMPLMFTLIMI